MEQQEEFLFADRTAPGLPAGHPLADLLASIAAIWRVPLARPVRLRLHDQSLPDLVGRLELARAPDLPLDARQPLRLKLNGVEFTHRDIAEWTAL